MIAMIFKQKTSEFNEQKLPMLVI